MPMRKPSLILCHIVSRLLLITQYIPAVVFALHLPAVAVEARVSSVAIITLG
jgi:hypothetical protein